MFTRFLNLFRGSPNLSVAQSKPSPTAEFVKLLTAMFTTTELRGFITVFESARDLRGMLDTEKNRTISLIGACSQVVFALEDQNLVTHRLFDDLLLERPLRSEEIERLRTMYL